MAPGGTQIEQSLRSIGIDVSLLTRRVAPYADSGVLKATLDDDLIENSRIYDVVDYEGTQYTVSVLDNQVHAAGYLNQVWQWLRLTGVSMRRDRFLRRRHAPPLRHDSRPSQRRPENSERIRRGRLWRILHSRIPPQPHAIGMQPKHHVRP